MRSVTASIEIARNPAEVWEFVSDPTRYPDWVDATERMLEVSPGEFGLGSVYREYGGIPPFLSESEWRVTRFEPLSIQTHEGSDGRMRMPLDIELEPTGTGTRLSMTLGLDPAWFMAPLAALVWPLMLRKRTQEVFDASVVNARRLLEEGT
jgi:hypothetical protein